MDSKYTAKLYLDSEELAHKNGDNIDELYTWMLTEVQGQFGGTHGEIIDNSTQEIVRRFRKSPPD